MSLRSSLGVFLRVSLRVFLCCGFALLLLAIASPIGPAAAQQPEPKSEEPLLIPPVLKAEVSPEYPPKANAEAVAATVVLTIDIDTSGRVERASIAEPATPAGYGFDEAALAAAEKLEFEPARVGTEPVPVSIQYRFRFVPDVREAPPDVVPIPAPNTPEAPPSGDLAGVLSERGTRLPIPGVRVTIFRGEGESAEGFETETDADGRFLFQNLGTGTWRILADPEGYYPLRVAEEVSLGQRTNLRYRIERRSYNAYDVLVETERVAREVSQVSIDADRAERIPGSAGDVLNVVQNFPGVARSTGGEVIVRGSAPDDTRVYVSGIDVPIIYHFGGLRSVLPVGMVEKIDFYPGNFSVKYGRATGGIIDVDLRDLAPEKLGGYADVSILDTSLYLETPVDDKTMVAVAGRRSYIDKLIGPFLPDDGTEFVLPRYYDAQALVTHRPSPAHRFETFVFYSDDRFEVLFEEPVNDDPGSIAITDIGYAVDFARAIASHSYVPNRKLSSNLKLSLGRDRIDFNVGEELFIRINNLQLQLREHATYEVSPALTLHAGIDYLLTRVRYAARAPAGPPPDTEDGPPILDAGEFIYNKAAATNHAAATFLQADYRPIDGFSITPGLRLDHFTRTKRTALSPRIATRLELGPSFALKGGVGLFVQETIFDETDEAFGNPNLELEKAVHYSLGTQFQPKPNLDIEVTGFYKTLSDLVVRSDAVREVDGESVPLRFSNGGSGRVIGMELSVKRELTERFFGWIAYTLSRAERRNEGETEYRLFDFDQTHILTLLGSYKLPRNWEISGRFRLVSGNLYTPFVESVYSSDDDRYLGVQGPRNSARVGAFNQVDVRVDKRWIYDSWILGAYLDIQNVFNRANPEGIDYNFDFSKTSITQGIPIIPVLGLRGEF